MPSIILIQGLKAVIFLQLVSLCNAFVPTFHLGFFKSPTRLSASTASTKITREELIQQIDNHIAQNPKGNDPPEGLLKQLEAFNTYDEPNRSPDFLGEWHVWVTDCPPPSNGQLGPFRGTASQMIQDSSTKSYQNLLRVPPNDWLTATLEGVWEDWDGKLLVEGAEQGDQSQDWGKNHWKVTFLRLQIKFFDFQLLDKQFPPDTGRVWRTTYLDDNVRIVRAGKTGRIEDEVVFYTKRTPPPF